MFHPRPYAVVRLAVLTASLAAPSLLVTTDAPDAAPASHGSARPGGGGSGFQRGGFMATPGGHAGRGFHAGGHRVHGVVHAGTRHGSPHRDVARREPGGGRKMHRPAYGALTPPRPVSRPSISQERGGAAAGWSGRTFWPEASRDVFGYTFRPRAGDESVWDYAYDDVFTGIFWPPTQPIGESSDQPANTGSTPKTGAAPDAAHACGGRAPGVTDWPFGRIEETLQPAGAQRTAFDALKAAVSDATATLRASCSAQAPATPVGRLAAIETRLAAMVEAVGRVRPALENFYATLSDEQKAQFDAIGVPTESTKDRDGLIASLGRGGRDAQVAGCGGERVVGYRDRTIQHIDKVVHPTEPQRAGLDELRTAASQAADLVRASCAGERPATPATRLEAIGKKLDAMLQAVRRIRPPLEKFYGLLSDEQKARFNAMSARSG